MQTSITLSLLLICFFSFAQGPKEIESRIDSTVHKYVKEQGFAGTILIAKSGQPIFHQSYGLAYYSTPDTIQNSYHYSIASITKLFTSIRILQLVENGKLDLHKPIVSYLPEFKEWIDDEISAHHLLLHISGLPNESQSIYRKHLTPVQIVKESLQKSASKPGEFNYNNIDYMLLGLIIETKTGQPWETSITQHILEPLSMTETGFLDYGYYPDDFAYTYSQKGKRLKQDPLFYIENFYAAGSMYATSMDLLKLDQALYSDQLLGDKGKELLSQSFPEYNYTGYSVWNYRYPFVEAQPVVMERRGGILGANVVLVRVPEKQYTIIILSNDNRFNPDSFGDADNLREILIRSLF